MAEPFTCENRRFQTDTTKGKPHGKDANGAKRADGSVFDGPLFDNGVASLWLEHVHDTHQPDGSFYWLMWYDARGNPTIPLSGVMSADDVREMAGLLTRFMELP